MIHNPWKGFQIGVPANELEGVLEQLLVLMAESTDVVGNQLEKPETASCPSPGKTAKRMVMF